MREFEVGSLPKPRWTHHAHFAVGLWYLHRHAPADALDVVRRRIRSYNEASGTPNTDSGGYHETLTRFYLHAIESHMARHPGLALPASLALLLQSPIVGNDYPLAFYSRKRLFSVAARRDWLAPDLQPLP